MDYETSTKLASLQGVHLFTTIRCQRDLVETRGNIYQISKTSNEKIYPSRPRRNSENI
jgi:hypothetical protein